MESELIRRRRSSQLPTEGGPDEVLTLSELPRAVRADRELRSGLLARYGSCLGRLRFRRLQVPLARLASQRLDDFHGHFEDLIEGDREYDRTVRLCGEEPAAPWEDGENRYLIACEYLAAFRSGEEDRVPPIVVDLARFAELHVVDLIDGHHRVQAAHESGRTEIAAYEVLMSGVPGGSAAPRSGERRGSIRSQ
ncbi:MAG: hypothetical protein H0U00_04380 [Actinobacteria bacterium]|nr:hypothetical protein [Actinomycetota bacterium]